MENEKMHEYSAEKLLSEKQNTRKVLAKEVEELYFMRQELFEEKKHLESTIEIIKSSNSYLSGLLEAAKTDKNILKNEIGELEKTIVSMARDHAHR